MFATPLQSPGWCHSQVSALEEYAEPVASYKESRSYPNAWYRLFEKVFHNYNKFKISKTEERGT